MIAIAGSALFVLIVLVLSLVTISKGYGYKHTIDPVDPKPEQSFNRDETQDRF